MLTKAPYEKESRGAVVNLAAKQQVDAGEAQGNRQSGRESEMVRQGRIQKGNNEP